MTNTLIDNSENLKLKVNIHGIVSLQEKDTVYLKIDDDSIVPIRGNKNERK